MRKAVLITVSIVFIIGASVGVYVYTHKANDKPPIFNTEVDRQEHVKQFVSQEQGVDPNHEITENAGGIIEINIENRGILMKFNNPDIMLSVDKNISNGIKLLPQIVKDTKDLKGTDIDNYFNSNKNTIISTFGIDNKSDFNTFVNSLSFIKDGSKITKATIDEGTMNMESNIITFNLNVKASNEKTQVFKIKSIVTVKEGKADNVILWTK